MTNSNRSRKIITISNYDQKYFLTDRKWDDVNHIIFLFIEWVKILKEVLPLERWSTLMKESTNVLLKILLVLEHQKKGFFLCKVLKALKIFHFKLIHEFINSKFYHITPNNTSNLFSQAIYNKTSWKCFCCGWRRHSIGLCCRWETSAWIKVRRSSRRILC